MKKHLLLLFALLFANIANATAGVIFSNGLFEYEITSETDKKVSLRKYDKNSSTSTDITIPSTVSYNETQYSVTSIYGGAFRDCSSLTSLTIPNSVKSIGNCAFQDCTSLANLIIEDGGETLYLGYNEYLNSNIGKDLFYDCPLTSLYLGRNLSYTANKSYGYSPYYNKNSLKSLTIGNSVTTISNCAFYGCSSLTSLTIPNSVTSIGSSAFYGCSGLTSLTIPNSVTSIGNYAFNVCSSLKSLTIPNSVTSIGYYAFNNCTDLTSLTIPNSVTSIGDYAFNGCCSLEKLYYNAENCDIGYESFSQTNIKELTIGENVRWITRSLEFSELEELYYNAENGTSRFFYECPNLKIVTIGETVKTFPKNIFSRCENIEKVNFNAENCVADIFKPSAVKEVIFGENVKTISDYAFSGFNNLTSVVIPNSVTYLGKAAFINCEGLISVTLGNSVNSIGEYAFYNCSSLTSITIPNSVNSIGERGFYNCRAMTSVTIPNSVTSIGKSAFYYCYNLTSVNTGSIEDWLKIEFADEHSNPTYYAKKILFNGETIRRLNIPEGTARINSYAFINCEQFVTISLPASLESVGSCAFEGCSGLQCDIFPSFNDFIKINYDSQTALFTYKNNSKIYINDQPFEYPDTLYFPESPTRIPDYAFCDWKNLKNIIIPQTITEIGYGAFYGCSGLTSIDIPNSVTSIGGWAFYNCRNLTSIIIPNSVISIGDGVFYECKKLASITFHNNSLTYIGYNAFEYCGIKEVIIDNLNLWSNIKFDSNYLGSTNPINLAGKFIVNGTTPQHLDLKTDNRKVSDCSFMGANNLTTVRVQGAGIGKYSFGDCKNLKYICLDVDSIDSSAFLDCSNIKRVYCMRQEPPVASNYAFTDYHGITLYVPVGSRSKYENAEDCWWHFLNIVETDFAGIEDMFKADYENNTPSSINDTVDIPEIDMPTEVYNLNGVKVGDSTSGLKPGIYIIRQGSKTSKVMVK